MCKLGIKFDSNFRGHGWLSDHVSSRSSIWWRGGPRNLFREFADIAKQSQVSEVSQYWPGSRALRWALEALVFLTIKYAFSHFSWYFFFKFFMYICVGTLQNIYFNMKDSGHFDKCNFWFLYLRKWRVLVVHLVSFGDILLQKPGVWGALRALEAVALLTVKYAFSLFSWYFSSKNLTYNYVGTLQNIYFNIKDSGHFDKFVLQNWFSLQIN